MSKKRVQVQHNGVDNVPGFFAYLENTSGDVYVRAEGGEGGICSPARCILQTFSHEKTTKVLVYKKNNKTLMLLTHKTVLKSSEEVHVNTFCSGSSQEVTACLFCAFPGQLSKNHSGKVQRWEF